MGAPPSGRLGHERSTSGHPLAVVVPTHRRGLRLRWLLNALAEQDGEFEVLVVRDGEDAEAAAVLDTHPLKPRTVVLEDRRPGAKRNAGWQATEAELIVFTDDDCRPPAGWLPALVAAAERHPGAIVQGATRPDPDELDLFHHAPFARSLEIDPVHPMGQTCNIAYPRAVLEATGGFDEEFGAPVGEDTDLFLRAQRSGAAVVAAPEALTFHAVEWGLAGRLRGARRAGWIARAVRRNPELRRVLPFGGWAWKPQHPRVVLAVAGLLTRRPWLALPWIVGAPRLYGTHPRGLARAATELPGRFAIDAVETAAVVRGSVRHGAALL